jgi:hypothetical protein
MPIKFTILNKLVGESGEWKDTIKDPRDLLFHPQFDKAQYHVGVNKGMETHARNL